LFFLFFAGTAVEKWLPDGNLYNSMIYPYMIGPMKVTGFTWYQGEANAHGQGAADDYAINFPKMIQAWREGFQVPGAFFGFVQLSTWCPESPLDVPELRQAQMAALNLSGKIGYATNADHGDGCNIHPPPKQYCGARLGKSALALQYGKQMPWKSPTYAGAKSSQLRGGQQGPSIAIQLKDVSSKGLYLLETPYNLQTADPFTCDGHVDGTCAGAQVLLNGKGWVKATVSLDDTGAVWFTATEGGSSDSIVATSYGWGSVPLMTIYDAGTDLPVLPWNEKV
jgi:Carbohydrate esterase, sialic acid-specific acetylesterase